MDKESATFLNHIAIDDAHIEFISGLISAHKPKDILELGFGSGRTSKAIEKAREINNLQYVGRYDVVDNFFDWEGKEPSHFRSFTTKVNSCVYFHEKSEEEYIKNSKYKYDLIVSDADHYNTHKWVQETFNILKTGGYVVYHDVCNPSFPNLASIVDFAKEKQYQYFIFNKSSEEFERCERGLLVVQKND